MPEPALRRAVFLDRDGTLIEERGYPVRKEDLVPLAGVSRALAALGRDGWLRIVLTNQSAIARGMLSEEELAALHADLAVKLARRGGAIDALYYCPHLPDGIARGYAHACTCRKPGTGLLELALSEHPIDITRSAFIGDSLRDLYLSVPNAGPRILVRSGHPLTDTTGADFVADTFAEAVAWLRARDA